MFNTSYCIQSDYVLPVKSIIHRGPKLEKNVQFREVTVFASRAKINTFKTFLTERHIEGGLRSEKKIKKTSFLAFEVLIV